jgi:regulator of sirC expression with transglutaminase-like and TPR domain
MKPTSRGENRARGLLLARLGRRDDAVEQLEAYLALAPSASDAERIQDLVDDLRAGRPLDDTEDEA